jgi:hypothetical protein
LKNSKKDAVKKIKTTKERNKQRKKERKKETQKSCMCFGLYEKPKKNFGNPCRRPRPRCPGQQSGASWLCPWPWPWRPPPSLASARVLAPPPCLCLV